MYLTKKEFKTIQKALELFPYGMNFRLLPKETQDIIVEANVSMINSLKRQKKQNEKTWEAIKEKRKDNPNYARPKKEVV